MHKFACCVENTTQVTSSLKGFIYPDVSLPFMIKVKGITRCSSIDVSNKKIFKDCSQCSRLTCLLGSMSMLNGNITTSIIYLSSMCTDKMCELMFLHWFFKDLRNQSENKLGLRHETNHDIAKWHWLFDLNINIQFLHQMATLNVSLVLILFPVYPSCSSRLSLSPSRRQNQK